MSRWENWLGEQSCECDLVEPRSLEELQSAVRRAARKGRTIRAAGGGYSWSALVPTDGTVVSMKALDRLLDEPEAGVFEVECGMTIKRLTELAAARQYAVVSPPLFPKPTVGGVIATGSHGMDSRAGNFCDRIRELKIVKADGSVEIVKPKDPSYPAAIVALGSLGIVYSVKLKLERQYDVHIDRRYVPVQHVLDELDDLRKTYRYLEIFWLPLQSKMWLYLMNRTKSKADPKTWLSRLRTDLDTWLEDRAGGDWIPRIARHAPQFTPHLNRLAGRLANEVEVSVQSASDAFHHQKAYPPNWDICYAVPSTDAARAWSELIALVDHFGRADRYPVNLALHCRFTGPSTAWLAPNYGRDTCYIEAATARGTPEAKPFFQELEARWAAIEGARPHWGKLFWRTREVADRYPKMRDFLAVRDEWDPDRMFLNPFLERDVFQLTDDRARRAPYVGPLQPVPIASPDPPPPPPNRPVVRRAVRSERAPRAAAGLRSLR